MDSLLQALYSDPVRLIYPMKGKRRKIQRLERREQFGAMVTYIALLRGKPAGASKTSPHWQMDHIWVNYNDRTLFSLTGNDGFYTEIIPKWPNYSGQ